ncbi:MAG: amidase [Rhodospirillales bacterium]|nr:amidase [Rhodospirillales bacterium]MBO6787193.1 amidase [Rhodospirillales bacterium]
MTTPNLLTATEAAEAIRTGNLTSRDLIDACIARAEERADDVGAWIYLNPCLAREQADNCDQALAEGRDLGPLHGVPVGLKDIIDTADMPTENGSALFEGRRPVADSTIARLLRAAGAVIMGKTVTTEFALSAPGKTKNPHDPAHTPGGSSSGSAAGVADHQVPLSVGTQTGGSMIRPASYCGIHGFKPTFGSISRAGMFPLARPLDHPGVYARSIDDIALIGDVLMVKDPADLDMRGHPRGKLADALSAPAGEPPKIAFVRGPMWEQGEDYLDDVMQGALVQLGKHVQEVEMTGVFDRALACQETVMMANVLANIGDYCRDHADKVREETHRRAKSGEGIAADDYIKAIEFRDTIAAALDRMFDGYDVLITAGATGEAPEGLGSTGNAAFQKMWTLLGVPTVTLPMLKGPNGLPIGLQVIGRYAHDGDMLRHARWIEEQF